eukprot:m.167560 g.167560  ORF g.167560 m.167560 type:complete len:123 (+) comp12841_c0_seq1:993-1361(+)
MYQCDCMLWYYSQWCHSSRSNPTRDMRYTKNSDRINAGTSTVRPHNVTPDRVATVGDSMTWRGGGDVRECDDVRCPPRVTGVGPRGPSSSAYAEPSSLPLLYRGADPRVRLLNLPLPASYSP